MQRLRLRYTRRGRMRFASHRDFQRALERALRRAGVPMAYSAGFTPHPKISYAGAAPTGAASEAEYVEISLTERCDPESVRRALDAALPEGFDVLDAVEARDSALTDRLEASVWRIEVDASPAEVARAVESFLARETVEVERLTKSGRRVFDIRPAVLRMAAGDQGAGGDGTQEGQCPAGSPAEGRACAILTVVVRHGTPAVRPDDVLAGLRLASGIEPLTSYRATRVAQGPWDEVSGTVGDPLAPDRDAAVTGP
ncbi:TIGR03936 family radical SAM-associated protein [Thermasporomyces composti]|uniref:TIGR03936 family radical SAM-associated protein n=1 Tax=Thermasporomyces composti TaxID=696763 RepID=UPI000E259E3F